MLIMNACENPDILSVIRIAKIVMNIIKIAVPILLILSLSINFMNAVKSNDADALTKANRAVVPKVLAAILVFYIPTFVNVIADISSYNHNNYSKCIVNANEEYISELITNNAKVYIKFARKSLKRYDFQVAATMVNKIKDEETKKELQKELKEIEKAIKEKEEKERLEREQKANGFVPGGSGNVNNSLGLVYYMQCDKRWGNTVYDTSGATLCSSACGYTSFAMIAAGLNRDSSINPYSVIKYFRNIGDGQKTSRGYGAASWNEIANNDRIKHYNLRCEEIYRGEIMSSLKAGKPVLILIPGHYMVLSYSTSGNIVLMDPYTYWRDSRRKSGEYRSYTDIEAIYGQILRAFAYSKI